MGNRQEFNKIISNLKLQMLDGPVEILTGPCAPLIVKDKQTLHEYACRLDSWMFPMEPARVTRQVATKPRIKTEY